MFGKFLVYIRLTDNGTGIASAQSIVINPAPTVCVIATLVVEPAILYSLDVSVWFQ